MFRNKYFKKLNEEIERHNLLTRLHNIEIKLNQLEEDIKKLINIYEGVVGITNHLLVMD